MHVYERIKDHEESKNHKKSSKYYMSDSQGKSVDGLFNRVQWNQREHEVIKRRLAAKTIVEIVKFIGKQGLSFRGHRHEAAYELDNPTVNHGIFFRNCSIIDKN